MGHKHRKLIPPGEQMATQPRPMGYNAANRVNEAEQALAESDRRLREALAEVNHNHGLSSLISRALAEVNTAQLRLMQARQGK